MAETENRKLDPDEMFAALSKKISDSGMDMDMGRIEAAYNMAKLAHSGQLRKDGSPYVTHCVAAADIAADMGLDEDSIVAALLHDVIEDTDLTHSDIAKQFGEPVANIVEGVTKLTRVQYTSKEDEQMENLRKMLMAMAKDIRVILIKIADRLHNMRTMAYQTEEKQRQKSLETMEIYAPIAHRLGMQRAKWELEDLALMYLDPAGYKEITDTLNYRMDTLKTFMSNVETKIKKRLADEGLQVTVYSRIKHIYSIYRKMYAQKLDINGIFDLCAFRVIVDTIPDCYNVLGIIHDMFKPVPGRFKDYISTPKPNMYQSVHTTVIGSEGIPFEVQIRTWEMHRTAEYGIAAHWKYKIGSAAETVVKEGDEEKFAWVRRLLESQQESDATDFFHNLKIDMFADEVFVFSPKGDVINLPAGATPIDFAYSIHSAVGNKMVGAKVNGKLVPIDYVIKNGDQIEIITSQNSKGPSRDWLKVVKSTQAKNKINQWFRSELKEENIQHGKDLIAAYAKAKGINFAEINKPEYQEKIRRKYGFHDWNSCLATVGHGGLKESQIVNRMYDEYKKDHVVPVTDADVLGSIAEKQQTAAGTQPEHKSKSGIVVHGLYDVAVHFSKCCNPVPGDEIVGFVTRGRGISIHRTDCVNIINLSKIEKDRLIEAEWQDTALMDNGAEYQADLKIFCHDRPGLLVDITKIFTEKEINISGIQSKTSKQGIATIEVFFNIKGRDQIKVLVEKLRQIESVIDVERTTG